jgi:hypothetical protein
VFHLNVTYLYNGFQMFCMCFHKCFICILLYVATTASNVSKVDRVLHMGFAWEEASGTGNIWGGVDDVRGGTSDVRGGAGPLLVWSLASKSPMFGVGN